MCMGPSVYNYIYVSACVIQGSLVDFFGGGGGGGGGGGWWLTTCRCGLNQ